MVALYVASTTSFCGKSAIAIALGKRFQARGLAVGYMKPLAVGPACMVESVLDEDVHFVREELSLTEPVRQLVPICLSNADIEAILGDGEPAKYAAQLRAAYEEVSQGREITILEGAGGLSEGALIDLSAPEVVKLLGARSILICKGGDCAIANEVLAAKRLLGESLVGVVINAIPAERMPFVREKVTPFLERRGIPVFGLLPEDKLLMSISVREIAERLGGELLCCPERADELVENLMVGAMSADRALTYFRRQANKAVITGGDRPDIQLVALETPTKCLILTGNLHPSPVVLGRAKEAGVPIVMASHDTFTTVEMIQQFFTKPHFCHPQKIQHFQGLMDKHFDFPRLFRALGLGA